MLPHLYTDRIIGEELIAHFIEVELLKHIRLEASLLADCVIVATFSPLGG